MAIDWSVFEGLACAHPKGRVKALDLEDKRAKVATTDKQENAKAKARAKGQCEILTVLVGTAGRKAVTTRCPNKDTQTHHLIYGIGRKNKGNSILAEYKVRTCDQCHADINAKKLKATTAEHDAATVRYWRSR